MSVNTREEWLHEATRALSEQFFAARGYDLPEDKIAVSVGFPRGSKKAIGQCWGPEATEDGTHHIFICPTQADPTRILDILLHELVHVLVGNEHKHGGPFKKVAREMGLEGKLTATMVYEGTETHDQLLSIASVLGPYPHQRINLKAGVKKKDEAAKGWVRLVSPENDTYKVVISPRNLEEHGPPKDPWGNDMAPVEK